MRIAHLSDSHIRTGALASEPAAGLQRALARTLALDPKPDCVIITGDLCEYGYLDAYPVLHQLIERFPLPIHLTTGNHDDQEALLKSFAGSRFLGGGDATRYVVEYPEATVVALDSKLTGSPAGELGDEQLAWLDRTLKDRSHVPAVLALHHPPIAVGIPFLDGIRLNDGPALAEVVRQHPHVVRVLAGHVHRAVTAAFAGSVMAIAPSTYRQSDLCMRADRMIGYLAEPTGFLLHILDGTDCITHTVPVSHASALLGGF